MVAGDGMETERADLIVTNAKVTTLEDGGGAVAKAVAVRGTRFAAGGFLLYASLRFAELARVFNPPRPAQLTPAAQAANNRVAGAIAANPARLSGFAVLPWQDPRAAGAELDRSVSTLGLKGAITVGCLEQTFLDDPGTRRCWKG